MQLPLELPQMGGGRNEALDEELRSHREENAGGECGTYHTLNVVCTRAFFTPRLPAIPSQFGEDKFGVFSTLQLPITEGPIETPRT